jgi:hypothetical protein
MKSCVHWPAVLFGVGRMCVDRMRVDTGGRISEMGPQGQTMSVPVVCLERNEGDTLLLKEK